ncbi:flagellar basal-body MS-ring/collar protein FliF [Buchnera aphidicola (Takecallis taiwana)]|uniref:flagellar basal-body MS-ring/collar protein FliF n=1 Tax=Buchnera aphidicola TaxID=9 RepID=UPI0031B6A0EE
MHVNHINHSNPEKIQSNMNFKNSSRNYFNVLLLILFLFFSIFFISSFFSHHVQYQLVCNHLSDEDSVLIISNLVRMKIPYRYVVTSGELLVPQDLVQKVHVMLLSEGLPKPKSIGFELLDQEKFGISPFNVQLNYQRALEGELSRSIQKIHIIRTAQVHLAFPKLSSFSNKNLLPSAAVILGLKHGKYLNFEQCRAITALIAASVPALLPNNVVIVDECGHFLNKHSKLFFDIGVLQKNTIQSIEKDCYQRITYILQSIVKLKNFNLQLKITQKNDIHDYKMKFYFNHSKKLIIGNTHDFLSSIFFHKPNNVPIQNTIRYQASVLLFIHSVQHEKNQLASLDQLEIKNIRYILLNVLDYLNIKCMYMKIINTNFLNNNNVVIVHNSIFSFIKHIPNYLLLMILLFLFFVIFKALYTFFLKILKLIIKIQ